MKKFWEFWKMSSMCIFIHFCSLGVFYCLQYVQNCSFKSIFDNMEWAWARMPTLLKKIDAYSGESETLPTLIFHAFFSALKVKCFQPNFAMFFTLFYQV